MLISLVMSLALTLVLEELVALIWGLRGQQELGTVALVNVLTNPPVVFLHHTAIGLLGWNAVVVTAVLETAGAVCALLTALPLLRAVLSLLWEFIA